MPETDGKTRRPEFCLRLRGRQWQCGKAGFDRVASKGVYAAGGSITEGAFSRKAAGEKPAILRCFAQAAGFVFVLGRKTVRRPISGRYEQAW